MKMIKKIMVFITSLMIITPPILNVQAEDYEIDDEDRGEIASKDEVVYGTLGSNGDPIEFYLVNMLEVIEAGTVIDYGDYTKLKNLTDLTELQQSEDRIEIDAEEGNFYYQGNLDAAEIEIPWDISITYFLDGKSISAEELPGVDGHLEIKIQTEENESAKEVFYENYMLQISITLDTELATNIETEEGMIASAGKNQQINFTVMPEEDEKFELEADVTDFEMEGISISGVTSDVNIDGPDTDELTDDIGTLADAIEEIYEGVRELKNGTADLSNGTSELREGSSEFSNGMQEISGGSNELVNGSTQIQEGLSRLNQSLTAIDDIDLSEIEQAVEALRELSAGLDEIIEGLSELLENYEGAYTALDEAMEGIPYVELSEEEIMALYESELDTEKVEELLGMYEASQIAKATYDEVKEAFTAVDNTLDTIIGSVNSMSGHIDGMADEMFASIKEIDLTDGLFELQEGVASLANNYEDFHQGLVSYTNGVDDLAVGYQELHTGITELESGTIELDSGVGELQDGTFELHDATKAMPEEMTEEIDEMIAQYDKSDFEAISFVSEKNEDVDSVQFVLTTESIEYEETKEETEEEEEKGFWDRLLDLFR